MERKVRFTVSELALLKSLFADNEPKLMAVRKFLYGAELSKSEQEHIDTLSPEAHAIIRKIVLPQIEPDAPLFQAVDLWVNINTKEQALIKSWEDMQAREIMESYLDKQLQKMTGKKVKNIDMLSLHKIGNKEPEKAVIDLMARNTALSHIDFQLYQAQILAGKKEETVEETQERLAKNSNK